MKRAIVMMMVALVLSVQRRVTRVPWPFERRAQAYRPHCLQKHGKQHDDNGKRSVGSHVPEFNTARAG